MMYATTPHSLTHGLPPKPVFVENYPTHAIGAAPLVRSPQHSRPPPLDLNLVYQYAFGFKLTVNSGPRRDEIIFASDHAESNWTHPPGCPPEQQTPRGLPYYQNVLRDIEAVCSEISQNNENARAVMKVLDPPSADQVTVRNDASFETQRLKKDISLSILLSAVDQIACAKLRGIILGKFPVALRTACVDLDPDHFYNPDGTPMQTFVQSLRDVARHTGTDIFVLKPEESKVKAVGDPDVDSTQGKRLRVKIYGDFESVEHAKTRVLIKIDDVVLGQQTHAVYHEVSQHCILVGRSRKNVKQIESVTRTAIYFPPPFPRVYGYTPPGANRRHPDEIFIVGSCKEDLKKAEMSMNHLAMGSRMFMKNATLAPRKIDFLLMERLDEVKKIMEQNGTFVQFPILGCQTGCIRVQGIETLHIERTIRSLMTLAGQYYDAAWWFCGDIKNFRPPSPQDFQQLLMDVAAESGAEIGFNQSVFEICGSDWSVRRALNLLSNQAFITSGNYQVRVKIELANEHKEFVAGKKNGKINKIMGQSGIHILFEGFNEYNFYIEVVGSKYDNVSQGLELVEQELPASMSFHVPDSYHKRIIGVGGQHIQTIMKKYSVFVKFSNAMERGMPGKMENEDLKVDNVICRTPARNAANLELVKTEIMDMVQQVDADIVTEVVEIPRLHHRELIAQRPILDELERKWSCTVSFPSTELASDAATIKGPEWQIPYFKEGLLALVPEKHQIRLVWSKELDVATQDAKFREEVIDRAKQSFKMDIEVMNQPAEDVHPTELAINFAYTRNDAGFLEDAINLLNQHLLSRGLTVEISKGRLSRPKSDSFEDFAPYFDNAVLQKPKHGGSTESLLNRPGSRLSGDMGGGAGNGNGNSGDTRSLHSEPGSFDAVQEAFYNGGKRVSLPGSMSGQQDQTFVGLPPGSAGSGSSRGSFHSRAGSLDSEWEQISVASKM